MLLICAALVGMLQAYSVKHIFGLCGDTSLPFYDALHGLDHGMEHILTRDERSAGYMADAYARVTGKVGGCEGPSGGGATHIHVGLCFFRARTNRNGDAAHAERKFLIDGGITVGADLVENISQRLFVGHCVLRVRRPLGG